MSMFKEKNSKSFVGDNRVTLDAKHNEMSRHFKEQKKSLSSKKKELKNLIKQHNELKNIPNKDLSDEMIQQKFSLADSISNLTNEIERIESGKDEYDYFLNTGHLLCQYYDNIESIAKKESETNTSIVDFFSSNKPPPQAEAEAETEDDTNKDIKDISDFVTTKTNFKRADILDNYLKITDPEYIGNINYDKRYDKCSVCSCEKTLIQDEGIMVCEACGHTDFIVIDSDRPSYKDPPPKRFGCKSNQPLLYEYTMEKIVSLSSIIDCY